MKLRFRPFSVLYIAVPALSLALLAPVTASASQVYENYSFTTFAGPVEPGAGYGDGAGSLARFDFPGGMGRDTNGNIYVADIANQVIRKISPDGVATTLAGAPGIVGSADGVASAARFNDPNGLTVDLAGNVYVADTDNHTIRKITPDGVVTTLAGLAGVPGATNGVGSAARFHGPVGLAVDRAGNIYVADTSNQLIRKVTPDGVVTTVAGAPGLSGSIDSKRSVLGLGGRFNNPFSLVLDSSDNIYVADTGNNTIRKITPAGAVTTLAGLAGSAGSADGTNSDARFSAPQGVSVDSNGNVYVADASNDLIRKITPAGVVTTIAGTAGSAGSANGTSTNALFSSPGDVKVDEQGNLYVTDTQNHTIRVISSSGEVTTLAGVAPGSGSQDGPAATAAFSSPESVAIDTNGVLYVADANNRTIRKITTDGVVSTLAGIAGTNGFADTTNGPATFNLPEGVTVDKTLTVYVADAGSHTIRKITADGTVSTLAGTNGVSGTNDGTGFLARFQTPQALAADDNGNVYVADSGNHAIRKVTADGVVTTLAGLPGKSGTNDGTQTTARFNQPWGVAVGPDGNIYVADTFNHTVRKVTTDGVVTTIAGITGTSGDDDGTNGVATLNFPEGISLDSATNIYVTTFANTIRKITPDGTITTLAGSPSISGEADGAGADARFSSPQSIVVDALGNLYVADTGNNTIRKGAPSIPDKPVVDVPIGLVGQIRHLSITNQTTTSWSWDFIRYPSGSSAQLSSPNGPNPTFTPDVDDQYVVRFRGWDDQGRLATGTLNIGVDEGSPSLIVLSPTAGQRVSNEVFAVSGYASDDYGVSNVWVQLNGGDWTNAANPNNWSVDLTLAPGTNSINIYAVDFSGKTSPTNTVLLPYLRGDVLTVQTPGGGAVAPNYNGQFLEIGQTYTMTAASGAPFVFQNWTESVGTNSPALITNSPALTFVMQSNLTFIANFTEAVKPTIAITSLKSGQRVSNAVYTVFGTASDNFKVANVWFQFNGGDWSKAVGTTSWHAGVTLANGANTFAAYAQDVAGNLSSTSHVSFTYVPSDIIQLLTTGGGTFSPNVSNVLLAVGFNYKITAVPYSGFAFSNWTGNVTSTNAAITFTMQSNLVLQANFVPNGAGNYAGLFYPANGMAHTNSGFLQAAITDKKAVSGKIQIGGGTYSFSGKFAADGTFSSTVKRSNTTPLSLHLQLDIPDDAVTGTIGDGVWTSPLVANRAVYSAGSPPQVGTNYTLAIPGSEDSSAEPGGTGIASVLTDTSGNVLFTGTLGDGTAASQLTFLSKQLQIPLYLPLYSGAGSMFGWLTFTTNLPDTDISGVVNWFKTPSSASTNLYPAGFVTSAEVVGSLYQFTNRQPVISLTNGVVLLDNGGLAESLTNAASIDTNNVVTGPNGLNLTITTSSGIFQGSVTNPVTGLPISIKGAVLQKQNRGAGYFLGTNQSGSVLLQESP